MMKTMAADLSKISNNNLVILVILVMSIFGAFVQSSKVIAAEMKKYEYPELLVTPSATARLNKDAKSEDSDKIFTHTAIQTSSLILFIAGAIVVNDERLESQTEADTPMAKWAGFGAMGAGGSLNLLTGAMSAWYTPYRDGWNAVKGMPTDSKRVLLERERASEERLKNAAKLSQKIKWLSVGTNFLASIFVIQSTDNNLSRVAGALSAVAAFSPLMFTSKWENTFDQHQDYKKRIYGPVSGVGVLWDRKNRKLAPALTLSWNH